MSSRTRRLFSFILLLMTISSRRSTVATARRQRPPPPTITSTRTVSPLMHPRWRRAITRHWACCS
uniref:Secreted protein n=1 Tax=Arundo donax TaxID=35708 RepID=A0A0A8ZUP4_ARUDO